VQKRYTNDPCQCGHWRAHHNLNSAGACYKDGCRCLGFKDLNPICLCGHRSTGHIGGDSHDVCTAPVKPGGICGCAEFRDTNAAASYLLP